MRRCTWSAAYSKTKSAGAIKNLNPSAPADFIFDSKANTFAVAGKNFKGGHTGLVNATNSPETVLGGRIKMNNDGSFEYSEWTGHYSNNKWTPELKAKFENFMKDQTGKNISGSGDKYFKDGSQ